MGAGGGRVRGTGSDEVRCRGRVWGRGELGLGVGVGLRVKLIEGAELAVGMECGMWCGWT